MANSACVSPAEVHGSETLNTLQYANRARNIQNKAEKNVESLDSGGSSPRASSSPRNGKRLQRTASELEIHSLQEQICFLKQQLDQANAVAAAATVVGTNIPSSFQVRIPSLHTKKSNDVRATERVTPMTESVGDDPLGVPLPVIPITTKASKIKPPSRSKLALPLSPKATARSLTPPVDRVVNGEAAPESTIDTETRQASSSGIPSPAGIVMNGALAAGNCAGAVTIQNDCPVAPAAVANLVTAIETVSNSRLVVQDDELAESGAGVSSSIELHAELLHEMDGGSRESAVTRVECSRVQESNHDDCSSTEQHDQEPSSTTCCPPLESRAKGAYSPHETTDFLKAASESEQERSEPAVGSDTRPAESSSSTSSPMPIESVQVEPSTGGRSQESETEAVAAARDPEGASSEDSASDRNRCEPAVRTLKVLADGGMKHQEEVYQPAPSIGATRDQDSKVQKESVYKVSIREDKQINGTHSESFFATECENQAEVDEGVTQACSGPGIWLHDPSNIDDEPTFSLVGPLPESESGDELSASAFISPESSPVARCTQITFVAPNAVEISSHESGNWKMVGSSTPLSNSEAGNQDPLDEAGTYKEDSRRSIKESEPQTVDTDPAVETELEPDFVLHRPPPCHTPVSPRTHSRGRFSPQRQILRPMNIFEFGDSWDKLQRSRPPSSVNRLESLVKVSVC